MHKVIGIGNYFSVEGEDYILSMMIFILFTQVESSCMMMNYVSVVCCLHNKFVFINKSWNSGKLHFYPFVLLLSVQPIDFVSFKGRFFII